jgi:DNA adenine methylase
MNVLQPDRATPFLKWAGGKNKLVPELLKLIPERFNTYHEPFLGGGALFFALQPKHAVLSDANELLVKTYTGVRDYVEDVIGYLKEHYIPLHAAHGIDFYNHTRATRLQHLSEGGIAAWMIYLNHTCFNGLWRVNKSGTFNVSAGKYSNPNICADDNLRACSKALQHTEILCRDFEKLPHAKDRTGELYYFDPPYVPVSDTANFTGYTTTGFDLHDQIRLRDLAVRLKGARAHVILSNAGSDHVRSLYNTGFEIREVAMRRNINSAVHKRGTVTEFIIR